ncbi:MAG TPA: hypothetical protein VFU36_05290 [Jatrophihabitans sp.]|nr:hypothetical protein [Jatrophihabitans sp.]
MIEPTMNNFNFLVGNWTVANRKLRERLVGCQEWEEFESSSVAWNLLDDAAQVDQFTFPDSSTALTLRLFDPHRQEWSLRWAASSDGVLLPPVIGRFDDDGVGTFYGDDEHQGTPVRVRYVWSDITENSARWEQAFSTDGGQSWEINWTMQLTRKQ